MELKLLSMGPLMGERACTVVTKALWIIIRAVGSGSSIAPTIFFDMWKKVAFSTLNISRLQE